MNRHSEMAEVLSSNLMRAVETAYLQFGHRPVCISRFALNLQRILACGTLGTCDSPRRTTWAEDVTKVFDFAQQLYSI